MSPFRLGLGVAALTALLWQLGALAPWHPRALTSLDLRWYFLPVYEAFYGALRAGAPMLWNPYQLCGVPWIGTLQGGFFYPPHLLYLLLPTPSALALTTVGHLALAAGGTAVFVRRAGVSAAGATLAAVVFACSGVFRGMQLWPYFLEATAWLPLGALAVWEITGTRPARGAIVLGLTSGMSWLAGCPQGTILAGYAWAALFAARLLAARPRLAAAARMVAAFALALLAGILLGAVALLPAYALAAEGVRRPSTLSIDHMYPFGAPPPAKILSIWIQGGAPALALAAMVLAPLSLWGRPRALALWAVAAAVVAALFSLGTATPFFRLYLVLPFLGWFRVPHRVILIGQFALAVAAGLGLDALARRLPWRRAPAALVIGLVVAAAVQGLRGPQPEPPIPYRAEHTPWSPALRDAYARLAETFPGERVWPFSPGFTQHSLPPKLPTLARLRSADDYEPLSLRRHFQYFVYLAEGVYRDARRREDRINSLEAAAGEPPAATRRRLLDLAAVRFVIMPENVRTRPDVAAFLRDGGFVPRPPLVEPIQLVENPHALPRAFVTYRASVAPPPEALLPILARASFDPLVESWVEGNAGLPRGAGTPSRGAPATIVRDEPHVVEIEATLAAPGLVVLADTYYPEWTATVDGVPASILPTNHLFRGVAAPAGTHRVRFAYRPRSVAVGTVLSLLAALGLGLAAARLKARPAA